MNFDGLQTRGNEQLREAVFELHGSNERLHCFFCKSVPSEPTEEFDNELLDNGWANCPACESRNRDARKANKRARTVGCLIPQILFNEGETIPSHEGLDFGGMLERDGQADLLLVVGTSLTLKGPNKLVKELGNTIKQRGGAVIYVDCRVLGNSPPEWFDVQFRMSIEEWSLDLLSRLEQTNQNSTHPNASRALQNARQELTQVFRSPASNLVFRTYRKYGYIRMQKQGSPLPNLPTPEDVLEGTARSTLDPGNDRPKRVVLVAIYHDKVCFEYRVMMKELMVTLAQQGKEATYS
ncbi:hypothetical protein FRC11_006611 [Ceratobasidium sp. 423]|nr:hypothetical protein FRC11_006611 [Ceratobasidium sp. 423]